ncbi:16S rRNA (adenine(1518)-N(6)/adenine(1519)-N(6))-dimethyltransferase RsmA [Uliginosibacterium sp. H3]|uniref:Ribosomal RNA small subunit methyltransferase A n=1 Tax=Uliginosibacterium silvisoli TaxID=3114758 RepID=A0ABU6K3L1_9RHOO|nr:16S rRNA (adenine(1518)-N(6)/adenine(1519)-N(6))-dimethyltransferase RsmA [Uliginosibacterium sp. H3]
MAQGHSGHRTPQRHQGHTARKRFGQNFLVDQDIIGQIVTAISPKPGEFIVEIGPGLGALTVPLLAACGKLHVVEIDRDLIARLHQTYAPEQVTVHEGDALEFDFSSLPAPLRVVGNLPYNISTPLLFHLADYADRVRDMTFMLQKEVVDRMVAKPGEEAYGRLSVMLQYRFAMASLFDVPGTAFNPPPKVTSAIVYMRPLPAEALGCKNPELMGKIVTAAFGQRRKTLRNTLRPWLELEDFDALGMNPQERGERLAVADFVHIADYIHARAGSSGDRDLGA